MYLFHYDSFKSIFFTLNVAFDFVSSTVLLSKLEFIAIEGLQKHSFLLGVFFDM